MHPALLIVITLIGVAAAVLASGHAVIYKRNPRSAALWVILAWFIPFIGPGLYLLLGINRVRRRATRLRRRRTRQRRAASQPGPAPCPADFLPLSDHKNLPSLARLISQIVERPLLAGNSIEPLLDGHETYPAMIQAIDGARETVGLASYIFDGSGVGADFVRSLVAASRRGVDVRVLIDDVDVRFSRSSAAPPLRQAGVAVGVFNPTLVPARLHAANLRNHRKILVVDGVLGFTGGMNIDQRYWNPENPRAASRDLHFRISGPVVEHLSEVFVEDWQFSTGEVLPGAKWFPLLKPSAGSGLARGIDAGPDETSERLQWAIIGGLNAAEKSVRILTPYFIPDPALISCLNSAAMRGVSVVIILPETCDLPHIHWAAYAHLWQMLERGCKIWLSRGTFDHSKLMVVDGVWSFLGSANWDTRSLRLNFEFNVECYDADLGRKLDALINQKLSVSRPLTLSEVNSRSLAVKIRDGIARLFAPFL